MHPPPSLMILGVSGVVAAMPSLTLNPLVLLELHPHMFLHLYRGKVSIVIILWYCNKTYLHIKNLHDKVGANLHG